ncbi:MAG: hypothetical protein ABI361_04940 [Nitrososphaera sp.]
MAEDSSASAAANSAIPFPTLTILYLPVESIAVVEEIGQKYPNITVEDCEGYFHGAKRQYKKITIWSQGIDSLWLNAIIARVRELASVEFVTIVTGGVLYVI